jgi:plasmid maintenance system antidote protein VapI
VIILTMERTPEPTAVSTPLRCRIVESGLSYTSLEKATGVKRASIMRFVEGRQSLHLDNADRLAAYFEMELRPRPGPVSPKGA